MTSYSSMTHTLHHHSLLHVSCSCLDSSPVFWPLNFWWHPASPRSLTPHQVLISRTPLHSLVVFFVLPTIIHGLSHSYLPNLAVPTSFSGFFFDCRNTWPPSASLDSPVSSLQPRSKTRESSKQETNLCPAQSQSLSGQHRSRL